MVFVVRCLISFELFWSVVCCTLRVVGLVDVFLLLACCVAVLFVVCLISLFVCCVLFVG